MMMLLSVPILETMAFILTLLLWGVSPTRGELKKAVKALVTVIALIGITAHYMYLLVVPTEKTVLPLFIIERKTYGVVYPDIGQAFILLLLADYLLTRRREKRKSAENGPMEGQATELDL